MGHGIAKATWDTNNVVKMNKEWKEVDEKWTHEPKYMAVYKELSKNLIPTELMILLGCFDIRYTIHFIYCSLP
jgi:hypothetical protein